MKRCIGNLRQILAIAMSECVWNGLKGACTNWRNFYEYFNIKWQSEGRA